MSTAIEAMVRQIRRLTDKVIRKLYNTITPTVQPVSESAVNHVGSRKWSFLDRFDVYSFNRCTVWPHYSVAAKTNILSETIACPNRTEYLYGRLRKYPTYRLDGTITTVGDVWHNYYHRYIDMIPKVYALHECVVDGPIELLVTDYFTDQDITILSMLTPRRVSIKKVPSYIRVECDTYIHLPRLSTDPARPCKNHSSLGYLPVEYLEYFRSKVLGHLEVCRKSSARIYVSRRDASKRKIMNEDELVQLLKRYDFEVVTLGDKSLAYQAGLFNNAEVILAQHGAALTNLLYVSSGSTVVEVYSSEGHREIHYEQASEKLDLNYHTVTLKQDGTEYTGRDIDGYADIDEMRELVESIIA